MSSLERELIIGQQFDRDKIELIKQTVAKGASDLELQLFFHACQRTGLDPLMKQIYAIKRWNAKAQREEMSIQTGIDGYRLIADRTGQYGGSDEPIFEELEENGGPLKATVTVVKLVRDMPCRFTASARWDEYVQKGKDGQPSVMWKKMPYLMLAKCAEALALRKAFPAELSGVYTHEEMMQADSEPRFVSRKGEPAPYPIEETESLEQPSPLITVPSITTGDTTNPQDYISKLKLSESVREASQVLNDVLSDEGLSDEDRKALQVLGKQRLTDLQPPKRGQGARG